MKKFMNKDVLKKILVVFLLLQPLLDTYILFEESTIEIFKISPSTVVRLIFIFIMAVISIFVIKSKKQWKWYILYAISIIIYSILHIYNAMLFTSYTPGNFNFSLFTELFYIIRLLIPLFIIVISSNIEFKEKTFFKIINVLVLLISGTIVVTNIFGISIGAYATKIIKYNIFDWFINNIHDSVSFYDTATRGYFSFANMISSLLFGFTAILFYQLFKNFNYKMVILIIIQMFAMFMLGTKVSTFGFLLSMISVFIVYSFFTLLKKEKNGWYKAFVTVILLGLIWYAIYPYSPSNDRTGTDAVIEKNKTDNEKEEDKDNEVEINSNFDNLNDIEKDLYFKEYVYNNYENFAIKENYILKKYPYEYDAYFWYQMFSEPYYVKADNRLLMQKILNRLKEINNRETMDNLFGLTYSRVSNIAVLERDFLSQYYTLGILGSILLVAPYLILIVIGLLKMFIDKDKFNFKNVSLMVCLVSGFVGAYYCGNTLDNLTFSIIYGFILGIFIKKLFSPSQEEERLNEDEITILALHLNYGGVEKYISSLCKMLGDKYKISIITTYKILEKPAFYFSDNINITYLIDGGPNRRELSDAIKSRNLFRIMREGIKSIKILYLKKFKNIEAIKDIHSKYVITTRYFHNDLVGKYANKEIIKIATEHNYHNNDEKYIRKVCNSCRNIDYFVLVSKELRDFYSKRLSRSKCVYIPNVIDEIPKYLPRSTPGNKLIAIGRLSPEKGFEDLIDIISIVKKEIIDVKLDIYGDGLLKDTLIEKIKNLDLEENIVLCGFYDHDKLVKKIKEYDIFLMSSYTESFGLVLLEAMSQSVPCIGFDCANGVKQLLKGGDGILVSNRNKEKYAKEIINLLRDKNKLNSLSKKGYNFAKNYDIKVVKTSWINLLEEKKK